MKRIVAVLLTSVFIAGTAGAKEMTSLAGDDEKLGYAMGIDLGTYLKGVGEPVHIDALIKGITDAYAEKELLLSPEEVSAVKQAFAERQQKRQVEATVKALQENQAAGKKFLAENKEKEGVVVTESGLQYKVIKEGDGARPVATDTVKVHYRGTLLDGTEFDSSYKRGEPIEFPVNQVIPGWQEALPLMKVGSTYEFYIPAELAYGDRGAPPHIGPASTLIFEVELLDIVTPEAAETEKQEEPTAKK
ncbi:MAG: hypothetical protein CSA34_06805 [Desulfobulbus propionicus]|nr:MAG: hypothetical protein CSA34_06805 [Desulfobulbus propionicus]